MEKYNPFINSRLELQFVAFQISEILRIGLGFDIRDEKYLPSEVVSGIEIKEATDNPFMLDINGNEKHYQRELVWDIKDKQQLIDSIYNYSDIGKFVVVRRSYDYLKEMINKGHTEGLGFHELVDGKQRLNCIAEFVQNLWPDSNGKFYKDIDIIDKRKFRGYNKCTIAILENPTFAQIKYAFLNVNTTGKAQSVEHINLVKEINL